MSDKTFEKITADATEEIRKSKINTANRLELTLYNVRLNHKQIALLTSFLEPHDHDENNSFTEDKKKLLNILVTAKVVD